MKYLQLLFAFLLLSTIAYADNLTLRDFSLKANEEINQTSAMEIKETGIMTTKNLAWTTVALLTATAFTGREKKANPIHMSLAGLSFMSYGMFLNSYLKSNQYNSRTYKWASYSKWVHIPAMIILPIAGAMALRDFDRGKNEAEGFGKFHKPAAAASVISMAVATLSLTFEF
ncbi:MAG: hypothetical protein H6621_10730 [Halobacteriovoraceae bacterium]|nr:hypothetical protein [Halobacteriovoraceae bacterium]MCB9095532.1 hypothetical protein [Halobacteriovoraceae bacterium]